MKTLATLTALIAAAPALAHDVGPAHAHPHADPALVVGALAGLGAFLLIRLMRGGRR